MKSKAVSILLAAILLLGIGAIVGKAAALNGPKADTLFIQIYATDALEFAAFEAGDIQMVDWPLDTAKIAQYSTPPENYSIVLNYFEELGMFEFDINNNETIPSAPGYIQPTSDPWFRTAMQYVVDKDYIVTTILGGLAARIDIPVAPTITTSTGDPYYDTSVQTYGYSPSTAESILDAHGYTMGTTWRINPTTGVDMNDLIFAIRADDTLRRTPAGLYFAAELEAVGIPVDARVVDRTVCYDLAMVYNDFNIYTGGWSLGRDPDWLYFGYNIDTYWGAWSINYNHVNDTLYNTYSSNVMYATTEAIALTNAYLAENRLMNRPDDTQPGISALIPLWSTAGYTAYRHPLVNAVNMQGYGTTNWWSLYAGRLNTSETGGTINWGFKSDVEQLNPLYSSWVWDAYILDKTYDGLLTVNPFTLLDMPWTASDWEVSTWAGGQLTTFTLNDGVTFHDGTPLTVNDVKFTIDYIRNYTDCWLYSNVADVDHVDVDPVQRKVYVYWGVYSIFTLHWVSGLYLLPKHIWETMTDPLVVSGFSPDPTLTGSGVWDLDNYDPGNSFTLLAYRDHFMPVHPASDVNFDMTTDIFDIINVAASFGKQRGVVGFNIIADVVAEWDIVDIFDLIIVASNFGTSWQPSPP